MSRWEVLKIRDFRLALAVRLFDGLGLQMLSVAAGWQIYSLTGDPLKLGLIGLAEALPYVAVALWVGQLVDRREKSRIIAGAEAGLLAGALGLLWLARLPAPRLLPLYGLLAWGGLCRSFQWTAFSTHIQALVPGELFPKAAAWNVSAWHAATIAGPALGGLIYRFFGAPAAYGAVAACFLAALLLCSAMPKGAVPPGSRGAAGLADFLSGVRFVFSSQIVVSAMALDMFGVLFGGVEGVLPIFAGLLGAGPVGLGLLRAAPALGALASSQALAHSPPVRRMGSAFIASMAAFGLCMLAFPFSRSLPLSLAILGLSGMVDGVGMVIRASLYQALTPEGLRGRVSAVNGIFIRSSNQLGVFESGLAARLLGLVPSVVFGGVMTLASVAAACWKAPLLRDYERAPAR